LYVGRQEGQDMALPAATLDHVVINARDDMDRAADIYRRLGFTLTERGHHSLGSMNHLAIFGTDYLELIALPKGASSGRMDLLDYPFGLNGLVFGSEDSTATYEALTKAGVPVEPPMEFTATPVCAMHAMRSQGCDDPAARMGWSSDAGPGVAGERLASSG